MSTEDKIFIAFLIVIAYVQWGLFAGFQHIPGPIYGGDLYRERGFVQHILNGEPYSVDPYFAHELEFYPPIGYVLAAKIVQYTGLELEFVLNNFPIPVFFLTALAFYFLGQQIFGDKKYALALVGVVTTTQLVIPKHTLGMALAFCVFGLAYYVDNWKQPTRKKQVLSGLFLGLTGLTHYSAFLIAGMILSLGTVFEFLYRWKSEKNFLPLLKECADKLAIIVALALIMSAVFMYPLYAKYRLATPNKTQIYSLFNPYAHGIEWVVTQFINHLFPGSIIRAVYGILVLLALWLAVRNISKLEYRFTLWWLLAVIIGTSHWIITIPLFNTSVVPPHLWGGIAIPFALFVVTGLRGLSKTLESQAGIHHHVTLIAFVFLIVTPLLYQQYQAYNDDRWVQYGKQMDPGTQAMYNVGRWILRNTANEDVFLAHDESSFAINAIAGRKLVMVRRTHASPYVDVDKRYADGFVMLYGANTTRIKELMHEYNVKFVYVDRFMIDTPMVTDAKYGDYLKQHGVNFTTGQARYDPASTDTPLYDVVAVQGPPQAILNLSTGIQQFMAGQQAYAVLYRYDDMN